MGFWKILALSLCFTVPVAFASNHETGGAREPAQSAKEGKGKKKGKHKAGAKGKKAAKKSGKGKKGKGAKNHAHKGKKRKAAPAHRSHAPDHGGPAEAFGVSTNTDANLDGVPNELKDDLPPPLETEPKE